MKNSFGRLLFIILIFSGNVCFSQEQTMSLSQISSVNIDDLSDGQIESYWQKAKEQGYGINDIDLIARAQGIKPSEIVKLKTRINKLNSEVVASSNESSVSVVTSRKKEKQSFGLTGDEELKEDPRRSIFGYDFFKNPNISFEPSLNISAPKNYLLGPGDEITINVYGAAENVYVQEVGSSGVVRIPNVGPISITGLTLDQVRAKINGSLRGIYAGIGAPDSSPYKVFTDVSISNIRRVQVNIIGEVSVPGSYSLSSLSTILNALYASGGPSENGTFRNIILVRNGNIISHFDIYKFLITGDSDNNLYLEDQDVIIVNPYKERVVVKGAAKRPGIYELKSDETFLELSKYFGGFTSNAYKDRLTIERNTGTQREVKEIDLTKSTLVALQDGDKISIGEIVDRYQNRVTISGAVYRPGQYELKEGTKLSDIFAKSLGVTDDAFLGRAIIYRKIDGYDRKVEAFSVEDVLNDKYDLSLLREDEIHVFSNEELNDRQNIIISGAVNNPRTISYTQGLSVKDVILMCGGVKYGADLSNVIISRQIVDNVFSTLSKQIEVPTTNLLVDGGEEFVLEPNDRVTVLFLKGFEKLKGVKISGEVSYPGAYTITDKDQRVSDLLERAGGLSPYAYAEGATLIRKLNNKVEDKVQKELLFDIAKRDSVVQAGNLDQVFRIGLQLDKILKDSGKGSKYDIILETGDELNIPSLKQTVEVRGEVLAPALISFDNSKSLKDYINGSGGFTSTAKKNKVYVIYANGEVKATKNFLFFKNYPKIAPGSVILIPPKPMNMGKGISVQEIIGITTGLGTIGLIIDRLSN